MKTDTAKRILELVRANGGMRPHELVQQLNLSPVAIHRQLKKLLLARAIQRRGTPPHVVYMESVVTTDDVQVTFPPEIEQKLEEVYCYFTPSGEELNGTAGFLAFLRRTQQMRDPLGRAREFLDIVKKAEAFKADKLIDGTEKIINTFEKCFLSKLYYTDFYSLPKYGKTRLGQYLLHGKSGQNIDLIRAIAACTKAQVKELLARHDIQAVAFVPHSIPRKIPFLGEYKRLLNLSLPEITLIKGFAGTVPIAQKSLSKLSERAENARNTIFVKDSSISYQRILVVDDAVGSGATLNEVAKKMLHKSRDAKSCKIYGYATVGSYKGFEVIKEV